MQFTCHKIHSFKVCNPLILIYIHRYVQPSPHLCWWSPSAEGLFFVIKNFFKDFFDVDHFKSLYWMCYNIVSAVYALVFWLRGMWDLSSLTGNQTCAPCIRRQNLNHWTAREVPMCTFSLLRQSWWTTISVLSVL